MLKQRIITAIILAVVFLAALFKLPLPLFSAFIATVVLIAAWEWANLSGLSKVWQRTAYVALIASILAVSAFVTHNFDGQSADISKAILMAGCLWWAIALLWVQSYPGSAALWGSRWFKALMGMAVLVPTWLAFSYLRAQTSGAWLILIVVLIVACADIGAYFSGKALGKHKLAPAVSPGKSWEGFWGGMLSCVLLAIAVSIMADVSLLLTLAIIIPAGLASVLGDLLESMVKRQRGIKDSSRLLPGHGGVLDRVDSLTAAAPVFALAMSLSGWSL
ncbi:phosphatidate cytidylyltransferase [uncultured Pseudoteredinibacter sp.]|uniref:phosphatidate cytidylyltransferase n=1 Tax=uncultured Pseudoteredinibacter sp. TaxID=1641701 RepID=UPI002613B829|nr:phosphatidate cytidylyltransferase [uncultured Pseudoteredinibacter sp.]